MFSLVSHLCIPSYAIFVAIFAMFELDCQRPLLLAFIMLVSFFTPMCFVSLLVCTMVNKLCIADSSTAHNRAKVEEMFAKP